MMKTETDLEIISYLTFRLGEEEYGTHVSNVLNILDMQPITRVPQAPEYMKGVINLRGMVLPVIDTRLKFGMSETIHSEKTCIIVFDLKVNEDVIHIGMLVDEVVAVLQIENSQIEPPPSIGTIYQSTYITGVTRINDRFIMILDMLKSLSLNEVSDLITLKQEELA